MKQLICALLLMVCFGCGKSDKQNLSNTLSGHTYQAFRMKSPTTGENVYLYLHFESDDTVVTYFSESGLVTESSKTKWNYTYDLPVLKINGLSYKVQDDLNHIYCYDTVVISDRSSTRCKLPQLDYKRIN